MTIIGPDRPGLVQTVAARVADLGGNWLESRMCHLGGQFAGILRVEVSAERRARLEAALQGLASEGLQVAVQAEAARGRAGSREEPAALTQVDVVGQDRPGILRSVSSVFATHQANVEELSSEIVSTPMGGGTLFQARAVLRLPAGGTLASLRSDLEKIAADLMVDIRLEPPRASR
ncbi:MAG TPA: ACT domain-containing protein [Opitutaceae bacterium]